MILIVLSITTESQLFLEKDYATEIIYLKVTIISTGRKALHQHTTISAWFSSGSSHVTKCARLFSNYRDSFQKFKSN